MYEDKQHPVVCMARQNTYEPRKPGSLAPMLENESLMENTRVCPDCTKTMIRPKRTVNVFHCYACNKSFHRYDLEEE